MDINESNKNLMRLGDVANFIEANIKIGKLQDMPESQIASMIKEFLESFEISVPETFIYNKPYINTEYPMVSCVKELLKDKDIWEGSATELCQLTKSIAKTYGYKNNFPSSVGSFCREFLTYKYMMQKIGIDVSTKRTKDGVTYKLIKDKEASLNEGAI